MIQNCLEIELCGGENLWIRFKGDRSAAPRRLPYRLHLGDGLAAPVFLHPKLAFSRDLHPEPCRKRIDNRDADPVETAGYLVSAFAEFSSGVEFGHDELQRGDAVLGMKINRYAPAVVLDGDAAVRKKLHLYVGAVTAHGLVNGVVHNFPDEVVETLGTG